MDAHKSGALLRQLRQEHGLTQRALAEQLHVSDRTISKWERGAGCPDVGLLAALAQALGVTVETILRGDCVPEETKGGHMRKLKFYVCPSCGNVLTAMGEAELSCCGRPGTHTRNRAGRDRILSDLSASDGQGTYAGLCCGGQL